MCLLFETMFSLLKIRALHLNEVNIDKWESLHLSASNDHYFHNFTL